MESLSTTDDALSPEQCYLLRRVAIEAETLDRDQLIAALCEAWEARFRLKQYFISTSRAAGFVFQVQEQCVWPQPESPAEFEAVFGYRPSAAELEAYYEQMWELATMELDMDAIVLTPDDDTGL